MKAVYFCRVSSKEQETEGYSLSAQEKLISDYSTRIGLDGSKVFSIAESASGHKQRQIFKEMLDFIEKHGIKVIVCEKVDRLTRNLKDAVDVNEWLNRDAERQVHFVKENVVLTRDSRSNEKFIWNIKVSVAQYYIDNLSEEVRKGQKEKIAQGWRPSRPPPGYKTVGEKGHKIYVTDPDQAPQMKRIFELYSSGQYSLVALTKLMAQEGVRGPNGNVIVKSRVHQLLRDPFYIGKIVWNGQTFDGKHEPLVSTELFDLVQRVLTGKTTPKLCKHNWLFKGLLHCKECTGLITWETKKGHTYGHCNHYRNCSQKTWAREDYIEEQLSFVLGGLEIKSPTLANWIVKALRESHKEEISYNTTIANELNTRVEQLQKRLDGLYEDKLDGKISESFYKEKFKQYTADKEAVLASIQKHSVASDKYLELGANVFDLAQKVGKIYKNCDTEHKRSLLRLVFERVYISEGQVSYDLTLPFKIISGATQKLAEVPKMDFVGEKRKDIFRTNNLIDAAIQSGNYLATRPDLLPR